MAETDAQLPESEPEAPIERPRRAHTILGRLSQAVREQNWFAVTLELAIVVVGVVIGFQVTAWGQARADADKEQTYLRQLAVDLAETERAITEAHEVTRRFALATHSLHRAFYTPERPPRDSVLVWAGLSAFFQEGRPVLGTVEALVTTGDLSLIRSDSLRAAILTYLEASHLRSESMKEYLGIRQQADLTLRGRLDAVESYMAALSPDMLERIMGVPLDSTAYFEGPRRSPEPLDVEQFLQDDVAREAVEVMAQGTQAMWRMQLGMVQDAVELRGAVEDAMDSPKSRS